MTAVAEQFREAIARAGLTPPSTIEADGRLHRFGLNGKASDKAGWYVFHADGLPAGAFGSWRDGTHETWRADPGRKLTDAERTEHRTRMAAISRERKAAEAEARAEAAKRAADIWSESIPATVHPYLTAKGVQPHGTRVYRDLLVVPVYADGGLVSLQFINADGGKRFLREGRTAGGHHVIGDPGEVVCISEGFATAASIHEATGHACVAAFNAGNLVAVAEAIRQRYPDARLILCADNDTGTPGNPGLTKAKAAAQAVGAVLAHPPVGDFNDLAQSDGPEAVRAAITAHELAPVAILPRIPLDPGNLAAVVDGAAQALMQAGAPIFRRGTDLYRVARLEADDHGPVRRDRGTVLLLAVSEGWLQVELARAATWTRTDKRSRKAEAASPSKELAGLVLARADDHPWPALRAIARHPVVTLDGRLIATPGYDAGSRLLLDFDTAWPVPNRPTLADAEAAVRELREHLRHYCWSSKADAAVALSMLVTALMRPVLPTAPLHGVDAPEAGSGKSLLAEAAAILATGQRGAVLDWCAKQEEADKRLDSALLAGDSIVILDNVEGPLEGAALCQTLTATSRSIRVMGLSKIVTAPCTALLVATGNNLTLRGDVVRRAVVCRLDPGTDRPELRQFDQNLIAETIDRRAELGAAALTIPLAYILAGRPAIDVAPFGSFDDWSQTVRAALVWAGCADPCQTTARAREADPARQTLHAVMTLWAELFGPAGATAAEAVKRAERDERLRAALTDVCATTGGSLNPRSLGNWLRHRRDTRAGQLVLRQRRGAADIARWSVVPASGSTGSSGSTSFPTRESVSERESIGVTNRVAGPAVEPHKPLEPLTTDSVLAAAAAAAGISADYLRASLHPDDLADPEMMTTEWLSAFATNLPPQPRDGIGPDGRPW